MSADVINIAGSSSSTVKGESLIDTVKNLEAMNCDILIVRHGEAGAAELAAKYLKNPVINAGDGYHEHPTQALLDIMTIKDHKPELEGLKVSIVGDIAHSRVARSNIHAMKTLGMEVSVVGPPTMIPADIQMMGVDVHFNLEDGIKDADIIMMLRIQMERQNKTFFPTLREFSNLFGLSSEKLKKAKKNVLILHPGPVNRGVEISTDVINGPHSVILNQVTNGVAIRMALMYLLLGLNDETVN
jgi:aspartate carbamoyltransferase catalytic subunit